MSTGCDFDGFNLLGGLDMQFSTSESADSYGQPSRCFPVASYSSAPPIIVSVKKRRVDDVYETTPPSSASPSSCSVVSASKPFQAPQWVGLRSTCGEYDMDVLDQMIAENARFMEHEESESEDSTHSSGNNSSSSGGSTSSSTLVPDDFRTPYSTRRGKIPKLLKHDIRRFYPAMFINVLNSQDGDLLTRYFERFHLPQSNLKLLPDLATCWTVTNKDALDASGRVHGRASVVNYFNVMFQSYPDLVFTLQDVELKRCNYSHKCRLNLRMRIQWTEMKPVLAGSTAEGVDIDSVDEPRMSTSSASSDSGDSHSSGSSSGSSCALPPMMQHEIEQLMEKARNEAQSKRSAAATEARFDASTVDADASSNEQPPIAWEKFAYEIFADVPFELDEEWYITQIDSCTLSRSLQKLNLSDD